MKTFDAIIWLGLFQLIAAICTKQQSNLNKFYLKCKATHSHTTHNTQIHTHMCVNCHALLPVVWQLLDACHKPFSGVSAKK